MFAKTLFFFKKTTPFHILVPSMSRRETCKQNWRRNDLVKVMWTRCATGNVPFGMACHGMACDQNISVAPTHMRESGPTGDSFLQARGVLRPRPLYE